MPSSLDDALIALENDQALLHEGGVFADDLIETWIQFKILRPRATPEGCATRAAADRCGPVPGR